MAKQTFTTGQVLTAAQMTSLQQTAMLGGAANAKVASYILVAADAGDAITMSNASATTITVNTGLFAAGDIVTIINLGTGICTITAGTATVSTSGSLALAQNQGGVLRFTSASESIFFQFATPASGDIEGVTAGVGISGGGTSGTVTITNSMATAITTNGDLIYGTGSGTFARLEIGSTNQILKVTGGVPVWGSGGAGNLTETVFTSSNASYTIPTGVTGIWALVIGGGGGGGATSNATLNNSGGAGGAGQVKEAFFAIAGGDTTLNITVGAGGAGGTAGGKGSTGSTSSIVGNTSATTYASAGGGGGGGGGAAANVTGLTGASSGGQGLVGSSAGGGGGGAGGSANDRAFGFWSSNGWTVGDHVAPTTLGVTGGYSGVAGGPKYGGIGVNIWGRSLGGGGSAGRGPDTAIPANFGGTSSVAVNVAAPSATANTGGGGGATSTSATTALNGGAGGSGLVVLRYVL